VTFGHGDLMPRNLIQTGDGQLALVDWECAGPHPAPWDRALLWVNAPAARDTLEVEAGTVAFWVCVAFALCRELKFRRRVSDARPEDPVARRLHEELAAVLSRLGTYSS
jgi:thiamine kinase-like enzyme